ncbi:DNA primase [Candidatus Blochmanniella chromaiodes str. 640]|uniref:DNA primase n=1 Tax=Candidatus Blochmanniella chromaiodes str. 640 TaxID=1240471 RepID=A0ABN4AX95_9ENTR|nr:DNA primase [Candidatus Blochmannia chromaiodes]AGC03345.1 DNA primase [Candidatus Blochmannia chromaiodes str. 640]
MTRIPNTVINELISRTNIVDLISQRVPLKKQGKNFLACCPFHTEKHPSFTVNIEKQFYYCFSCGSHGNVIDFLMHYDRLTFLEAIKELSIMHGISIEKNLNVCKRNNYLKNNLYQLMNKLCAYYKNILTQEKYLYAYKYLKNRGLNTKTIDDFNIGFAPPRWNNIIQKFGLTLYDQKLLDQSGMLISSNTKKYKYDRFRDRLMFPIRDIAGRIVAFGGRVITQNKIPKYLNSPDTEIFKKSQHLYGLYEARMKHRNLSCILLVEGYIDVVTLTQFGINYAVAALGTSTTDNHIRLLYSITDQIICCYDGDYAGKKAAWRTLNTALPYLTDERQIHFAFLPHGEDPDTLIRKIGKDNFLKRLTQTQDLSNFLFETLSKKTNLQTLSGRVKLSSLILPILKKIPGQTLKLCLLQQLGNKIGILDDNKLNQLLTRNPVTYTNKINRCYVNNNIGHILVGLLIQNPRLSKLVPSTQGLEQLKQNDIVMFIDLIQICKTYPISTSAQLLEHYRGNKFFSKLESLAYWNHLITNDMIETTFVDALTKLYNLTLEKRQELLIARDRTSGLTTQERQELWLINQTLSKH